MVAKVKAESVKRFDVRFRCTLCAKTFSILSKSIVSSAKCDECQEDTEEQVSVKVVMRS